MKKCKKCFKEKSEDNFYFNKFHNVYYGICKDCQKNSTRTYRIENQEKIKKTKEIYRKSHLKQALVHINNWRSKNPEKCKAQELVASKIRKGEIKRGNCSVCGKERAEAHHPDYSKPLKIVWLCKKHHVEEHKKIKI